MTNVALYNQDGSPNGTVELNDVNLRIELNETCDSDAILRQRASMRQGTHAVKEPFRGSWWWKEAMASKGNWTCPSRVNPGTTIPWWWYCIRTNSSFIQLRTSP